MNRPKPVLLLILDGWGHSTETEHNAIAQGQTPVWDRLLESYPNTLIDTSGERVGLPDGQMGNSEVGHMNLGSGRVVFQDFTRITRAIREGSFARNTAFTQAVKEATEQDGRVHIMGLLSPGGVHSHEQHVLATIDMAVAQGAKSIFVHAFLDGRDTPPRSAQASIALLEKHIQDLPQVKLVSLCGRYYAMDRDNRWDRVEKAWKLLTQGEAVYHAEQASDLLEQAYQAGENDEFVQPALIESLKGSPLIQDKDAVLFINFRADRARELTRVFVDEDFDGFDRGAVPDLVDFVSMTEYQSGLSATVAYPPLKLPMVLGEYAASLGLRQLRIAETEKYAHVTFFFNGGREQAFDGEERILVPSPQVATYDLKPEMSLPEVSQKLVKAIESDQFDLIICNIANGDMVGHTGDFSAALKAVSAVDEALGQIEAAILDQGGAFLITADHGNIEKMQDEQSGQAHTAHTTNLVPLIYSGPSNLSSDGALEDIAPTLLDIMHLDVPDEMTGKSLLENPSD